LSGRDISLAVTDVITVWRGIADVVKEGPSWTGDEGMYLG
jgi:hypothetical protein